MWTFEPRRCRRSWRVVRPPSCPLMLFHCLWVVVLAAMVSSAAPDKAANSSSRTLSNSLSPLQGLWPGVGVVSPVTPSWLSGSWGPWSSWSECTRPCGTGVAVQTRECRRRSRTRTRSPEDKKKHRKRSDVPKRPEDPGKRKRKERVISTQCVGQYKRVHVCNEKACSGGNRDFRALQCEEFNRQNFSGRYFQWEPFLNAPDPCQLNCRARGFRFYATLKQTVVDGTACAPRPPTAVLGERGVRWLCVTGICQRVGCDGVVGSGVRGDACGVCGGDNTTCRVVSGIFTRPHLPQGLNVVALLPQSACNISIAQLRPTSNLLGLRRLGGRVVVWPGAFDVGGTHFAHSPADALTGETLTAPGPLTEPIELVLTYQQPNPGIKYEYSLPRRDPVGVAPTGVSPVGVSPVGISSPNDIEVADPDLRPAMDSPAVQRGKGRRYVWRLTGLSDCSKSCGGGSQQAVVQCVRENTLLPVSEKRCQGQERPSSYSLRCGTRPCPAQWSTGDWSGCSVTCGSGTQTRELSCRQEISSALAVRVADGACLGAKPDVELVQPCRLPPCAGHHAHPHHHHHHHGSHHADTAGHPDGYPNLQDSVQGSLQADKDLHEMETTFQATTTMAPAPPTKSVVGPWSKCSSECGRGVRTRVVGCPAGASSTSCPAREEPCDAGPCPSDNNNNNQWLASEWSTHCSAECGAGVQSRSVVCPSGAALTPGCEPRSRPAHTRACSAESPHCRGQWFASPWGPCSATCGQGVQTRGVACVQWQRGQARYEVRNDGVCDSSERPDQQQPCAERACPPHWYAGEWSECSRSCGTGGQKREVRCIGPAGPSTACPESTKLPSRKACLLQDCRVADRDEQPADTQDEPADAGVICEDRLRNCHLVVQARLCKYSYYGSSCCHSCRRKGD